MSVAVFRQFRSCAKHIASEQSLNIANALHHECFDLVEIHLQTITGTSQLIFADLVEPSLSHLQLRKHRWRCRPSAITLARLLISAFSFSRSCRASPRCERMLSIFFCAAV